MAIVAGIEGGGTKFICGIGNEKGEILDSIRIETTSPTETMDKIISYFQCKNFEAIGVGVFGPIELDRDSEEYGTILSTPKIQWQQYNIYKTLKEHFNRPIVIEHDVNAALLGELTWGAAQGLRNAIYYTVGTGVGAGLWLNNQFHHGELHGEIGHMLIPVLEEDTPKGGSCPFHKNCLEGLVSGPGIYHRFGIKGEDIPQDSPIWDNVAHYISIACVNTTLAYAPQRIILGGGVMNQEFLLKKIQEHYLDALGGYGQKKIFIDVENFIVPAQLHNDPGLMGAFALANKILL